MPSAGGAGRASTSLAISTSTREGTPGLLPYLPPLSKGKRVFHSSLQSTVAKAHQGEETKRTDCWENPRFGLVGREPWRDVFLALAKHHRENGRVLPDAVQVVWRISVGHLPMWSLSLWRSRQVCAGRRGCFWGGRSDSGVGSFSNRKKLGSVIHLLFQASRLMAAPVQEGKDAGNGSSWRM